MKNKKLLIIISVVLLVGIVAAAYYFSSGILFKGEISPLPPDDDSEIAPLATNAELLDDIIDNKPIDDALLLDGYDATPTEMGAAPKEPVDDALLLDGYDAPPSDTESTPEEPVDDALLLDGYDAPPPDPETTPEEPVDDALLLDGYDAPPPDPETTPEEPVDDALLLDGYDAPPSDTESTPEEPVDDALYSLEGVVDDANWIDSTRDDRDRTSIKPSTAKETLIIEKTTTISTTIPDTTQDDGPPCGFDDIEADDIDCEAFLWVKSIGAMTGIDGNFLPNELLQRDQIIKVVGVTFNLFGEDTALCQAEQPFPDIDKEDWACEFIFNAKNASIATGYGDGTYKAARFVSRAEFLAFVIRNLDYETVGATTYTDIVDEAWYKVFASYSYDHSLFEGEELTPNNFTSRREVAKILFKLHNEALIE